MSEFVPIPGVWYDSTSTGDTYLYAPLTEGPLCPFWSMQSGKWMMPSSIPNDLLECYNPHPFTSKEWEFMKQQYSSYSIGGVGVPNES